MKLPKIILIACVCFSSIVYAESSYKNPDGTQRKVITVRAEKGFCVPAFGMTTNQVEELCGKPFNVNKISTKDHESQQWIMKDKNDSDVLYFENGVLTSAQTKL